MIEFLDQLLAFTDALNGLIWWPLVIIMLFACGIYMTIQTRGIQFKHLFTAIRFMFLSRKKSTTENTEGEITPFQALMTALAATVGNGNIAGVATAIIAGGAGAPFWMWMTAMIGMSTKFAEGMLGLKFRKKAPDGHYFGGAMYYMEEGIPFKRLGKILAIWFSLAVMFMATFGSGNMAQSNSIALALKSNFSIDFSITSVLVFILSGIILIGGIKRIASFSDKLVPSMIILYVGASLVIIVTHLNLIPAIFFEIIDSAFTFEAVGGGVVGHTIREALRFGVERGTLSSESGIGSCSIPAAASKGSEPVAQGLVAMMGTFIDTIVVCSMTTFVILASGLHNQPGLDSVALTIPAFTSGLSSEIGGTIVSLSSAIFGFTTLIGWAYIGESGFRYLFKTANVNIYRIVFCFFAALGALFQGEYLTIVWNFGGIANAFMAIPNIIALFFLGKVVKEGTADYFERLHSKKISNPFGD